MEKTVLIICGILIFIVYFVITIITSVHVYARLTECSEVLKKLKPEVYYKSTFAEEWETPLWYRIKASIKMSYTPLFHIKAMIILIKEPIAFMEVFINSCRPKEIVEE